jgi:hypothetical protein
MRTYTNKKINSQLGQKSNLLPPFHWLQCTIHYSVGYDTNINLQARWHYLSMYPLSTEYLHLEFRYAFIKIKKIKLFILKIVTRKGIINTKCKCSRYKKQYTTTLFLAHTFLSPWWWRCYIPLKCRFLQNGRFINE